MNFTVIGERARMIRKARGLSQAQVAQHLGLSSVAYGHYERGRSPFSVDQLEILSQVLRVRISYLFGEGDLSETASLIAQETETLAPLLQKSILLQVQALTRNSSFVREEAGQYEPAGKEK